MGLKNFPSIGKVFLSIGSGSGDAFKRLVKDTNDALLFM